MVSFEIVYFSALLFVFGLVFGSFFNVCIYRIPNKLSISFPASHCPRCKQKLKPYHNIPLFSYLFQKGKCAFCKEPISLRYPLVELLTGALFFLTFLTNNFILDFSLIPKLIFVSIAIIIIFIDIDHKIIPDRLSLPLIPLGVIFSLLHWINLEWKMSLLAGFIGFSFFYSIAWFYQKLKNQMGLGGGDIKLIAGIGTFFGLPGLGFITIVSSFLGIITVLLYPPLMKKQIPFGPYLLGASLVYMLWGDIVIKAYMQWAYPY